MTGITVPPERDFPAGRLELRAQHVTEEVTRLRRRRRRQVGLALVASAAALLGATGFTTYVLTREPTHFQTLGCYERADLEANVAIVAPDGRHPVAVCREVWGEGGFLDTPAPASLTACVLESGAIGVFPGSGGDTCERLGIAALSRRAVVEGRRFSGLLDAIVAELGAPASGSSRGSTRCVGEEGARAVVRKELDARGYAEWQIEVGDPGYSSGRPCTEVAFDGERKTVILIPVWRD